MSSYELTLPIRRSWVAIAVGLFLIPWLDFFRMSMLMARGLVRPQSGAEFVTCIILGLPFLFISLTFGLTVSYYVALNLFGSETLELDAGKLRMRQSVLGMGRWQVFRFEEVSNLRVGGMDLAKELRVRAEGALLQEQVRTGQLFAGIGAAMRFLGIWPGLMFRARNQTRWFGSSMDEMEAREVLARLRMHLPEGAFVSVENS